MFSTEGLKLRNLVKALMVAFFTIFLFSAAANHDIRKAGDRQSIATEIPCPQPAAIAGGQLLTLRFELLSSPVHSFSPVFHTAVNPAAESVSGRLLAACKQRANLEIKSLVSVTLFRYFHFIDTGDLPPLS